MSKKIFAKKEMQELTKNPYVKAVSPKGITYTDEFRRIFIAAYDKGLSRRAIFEDHGFDYNMIGKDRIDSATRRWRKAYREHGIDGLKDTRKDRSGGPRKKELTIKEKYARLEAQNRLLKAENELLKKIDLAERRLRKKK